MLYKFFRFTLEYSSPVESNYNAPMFTLSRGETSLKNFLIRKSNQSLDTAGNLHS